MLKVLLMFLSMHFIETGLILRSLIHVKLNFAYGVRKRCHFLSV